MTKIATDFASKLAVAFVAVAMVIAAFAPAAQAQTTEDLQQMINDLLAQVAQLQAGADSGSASVGNCPMNFSMDLGVGSEGAEVKALQEFLNSDADTRVAAAGSAGSAGMETMYYGPATAAAVSKFQVKYRADILSPLGLVNPTGYWGAGSRAKANAICSASIPTTGGDDMDEDVVEDEDEEDEAEDFTLGGEASLDTMEIDSASDDEIQEGSDDAEIAEVTLEFADGDAEVSRIDITLDGVADVWDVFESISLWVDGDKIAEENADDEDDYLDTTLNAGELRFSGLDLVVMEDEEVEIVIAATVQNVDFADLGTYTVSVDALRFFDADGVATTEKAPDFELGDTVSFEIQEEGEDDELIAKTSSADPDATTLPVEDDSKSDWFNVFTFDLDTDDSENDIELNTIAVNVVTTVAEYSTLVDDAEIVIDGVNIDDVVVTLSTTTFAGDTALLTFDVDGDVVIDAGDRVEAELMLRFKSLASTSEGATVRGSIDSLTTANVDAEGADDLDNTQLGGAATGDAHTLRTTGVITSPESDSATVTTGDGVGDDYATFEITINVDAFEQDVRLSTNVATSVAYSIVDGAGAVVAGAATPVLTSSADENGGYFEINEGASETLTLQVTFDATSTNSAARLRLDSITFDEIGTLVTTDDQTQTTLPETDYRTGIVTLVN